jgi:hypothetical protein
MKAGGTQVYFTGDGPELGFSTGRIDGSGGDHNQSSHWKDDGGNTSRYIGLMDPTVDLAQVGSITQNEVTTLEKLGWTLKGGSAPTLDGVTASLAGNVLTVEGMITDPDADAKSAQVVLLDAAGAELGTALTPSEITIGAGATASFIMKFNDLSAVLTATQARVTFLDRRLNVSASSTADFSKAEAGGGTIASATYNGKKLTIQGTGFTGTVQLEINGVVPSGITVKVAKGTKVSSKATATALGLKTGANRVRVLVGGKYSNITLVTL